MTTNKPSVSRRLIDGSRQRWTTYRESFSFVGLVFALLFFCASVTPSLLPRPVIVQGLLSGFAIALGYGVGNLLVMLYRFLELKEPERPIWVPIRRGILVVVAMLVVVSLWRTAGWQNSVRELMGMEPLHSASAPLMISIAILWAVLLIAAFRLFQRLSLALSGKLERYVPRRISRIIGFSCMIVVVMILSNDLVVQQLLRAADQFFLNVDMLVDDDMTQPDDGRTGSETSLVAWDTIGRQGKRFLTTGPTREEIAEFTGRDALDPIRVYVGMRTRETPEERAKLALEELKRVGGFDRSKLIIATPTGTGWLDPGAVDTVEFLHHGDTAIVSTQYSYLPSWITILVDPHRSIESADALFAEVYDYWTTLPKESRPDLYLHGLSLGSLGGESSTELGLIFEDPIQGAVFSGPPFPSRRWQSYIRKRNEGTPPWMPKIGKGRLLRFTAQKNHLDTGNPWGPLRVVYIQYASDPMVWFSPDLLWERPDWMETPRGPDVSPDLRWSPIVTFLQIGFDLPVSTSVPNGHGHNYSPASYIDAWSEVTEPTDWTAEMTTRLKERFRLREAPKA